MKQFPVTSKETKRGSGRVYQDTIWFELHGCKSNSLYLDVLKRINGLSRPDSLYYLRSSIDYLAKNCAISLETLKRPTVKLSTQQIKDLFISIDDYFDTKDIADKYGVSFKTINTFKQGGGILNNGDSIEHVTFKSKYPRHIKVPRLVISELPDPYFSADTEVASPISMLRFKSEKELQKKMLRHFEARNDRLENIYISIINEYFDWRELIVNLKQKISAFTKDELIGIYTYQFKAKNVLDNHVPENRLQAYLKIIDDLKLYKLENFKAFRGKGYQFHSVFNAVLIAKYPALIKHRASSSAMNALYCDYYLSPVVLYAIQRLFQIWFSYNNDTVKQLVIEDFHFKPSERFVKITPTKHKTDDQQAREIDKIKEPFRVKVVELIIWHYNNINKYSERTHQSVWAGLKRMDKPADLIDSCELHKKILKENNHPYFSVEQIRDQMICTELAKKGNPFEAMKLAGHKSLKTLINYANQSVIRIASKANINEFQQQLNNSILWVTKRSKEKNINVEDINKRLLFPVSDSGYEDTLPEVDEWLEAIKNDKNKVIMLTEERIEWCLRQHLYYTERWESINRSNPERFKIIHLPRIIFTSALQKVIQQKQPDSYKRAMDVIVSGQEV